MKVTLWVKPEQLEKFDNMLKPYYNKNGLAEEDYLSINFSTTPDAKMIQVQIDSDRFIEFLDKRGNKCKTVLLG